MNDWNHLAMFINTDNRKFKCNTSQKNYKIYPTYRNYYECLSEGVLGCPYYKY